MITVAEISECFPNKYKPVTGEFILQHARALSKYCKVNVIVPLRLMPSKEILTINPFKLLRGLFNWVRAINKTKSFIEGDLNVIYFKYVSLPRPYFESKDKDFINFFFYKRLLTIFKSIRPDIIYCHWIRPWAAASSRAARELKIPFILDHHEDIPTLKKLFPDNYESLLKIFEKADKVIVHSSANYNELLNEQLKLNEVKKIYLGQNFQVNENTMQFSKDKIKIICVSHLSEPRKNIDVLIRAIDRIKNEIDIEAIIVGDGILKDDYMKLSESLELESCITFSGSRSQKEVEKFIEASDIFILPSYPEAFGVVLIEALAKGLPVITCEGNGGGEELKLLNYPAVLIPPSSEVMLAEAILKLAKDKTKLTAMSEAGKEIVRNYFSWDLNAKNSYGFLENSLKEFKRP